MSKIISIATAVPEHKYDQKELYQFADAIYSKEPTDSRKLKFLYDHSGINTRYSVLPDFRGSLSERTFFPVAADLQPEVSIEKRMHTFNTYAAKLSCEAIKKCIAGKIESNAITHLITVTCTGMSAPGLDLHIMELLDLPSDITRTAVNFMGCYAAVHALRIADAYCSKDPDANVLIVCTELCTLHFQTEPSQDNITSSLLFGDGCSAILMKGTNTNSKGIVMENFFSDVSYKGSRDMAWQVSSQGFLMTLTGYVPDLIKADFKTLAGKAIRKAGITSDDITHWCIHPGGKKILEAISSSMNIKTADLRHSYEVLKNYGNMSSATILFVLQEIFKEISATGSAATIFGAAFGPGLTMETFIAKYE